MCQPSGNLRQLMNTLFLLLLLLNTFSCSDDRKENQSEIRDPFLDNLQSIATVIPRPSSEIRSSRWGLQLNKYAVREIDLMLEKICASGVKWARVETRGYSLSPEEGYYNWTELDKIINGLVEFRINIFLCFDDSALGAWEEAPDVIDADRLKAWLIYIDKLVNRYKDQINHWEILNEPAPVPAYADIVKKASGMIKAIDPDGRILAGSLARVDTGGLKFLLDQGVGPYIDVVTYHPYNEFPEACKCPWYVPVRKPPGYLQGSNLVADMRKILAGESRRIDLWQGECGYPSSEYTTSWKGRGPWGEQIQAKWLLRRFLTDFSMNIPVSVYFLLCEIPEEQGINAKGLIYHGTWEEKPAFHALQHLTALIDEKFNDTFMPAATFRILHEGIFFGITRENEREQAPYEDPKAPYTIQVVGLTGNEGRNALAYWLPWRMQEIISAATVDLEVNNFGISDPVLVDLLGGQVYRPETEVIDDVHFFRGIPLADYPLLIIEEKNVGVDL